MAVKFFFFPKFRLECLRLEGKIRCERLIPLSYVCNPVILIPVYTVVTVSLFPITSQHQCTDASTSHSLTGISETSQLGVGLIRIRDEAVPRRNNPLATGAGFVRLLQGF